MRALLSAFACAPNRGSEWESAWARARELAEQYAEVVVVTHYERGEDPVALGRALEAASEPNVRFLFFRLPPFFSALLYNRTFYNFYAYLWEIGLFFFLRRRFGREEFAYAQRGSYGVYRLPSFLWYFGQTFVLDPVAGGERVPLRLLPLFSPRAFGRELYRMVMQRVATVDPLILLTLHKAHRIAAASSQNKTILPAFAQRKCTIVTNYIAVQPGDFNMNAHCQQPREDRTLRLLFVGRLLEWKGVMLALRALKTIHGQIDYEFNIDGSGPARACFEHYARRHGLHVNFLTEKIARRDLSRYYYNHDLFVFPCLYQSGGYVVLEAELHGLPILGLDVSMEEGFIRPGSGTLLDTRGKNVSQLVAEMANVFLTVYQRKLKPIAH